jgi:hypothetical protein
MKTLVFLVAVLTTGMASAAAPGPDPRLEQALNTNVISQVERSVRFERTLPQVEKPRRPVVDHGEAAQVAEDVYLDRRLAPAKASPDGGPAIRVFPRDR